MSLSRLMLRCLTMAALTEQDGDAHAPTMAGDSVYDSRLNPLQFNEVEKDFPSIVVYTDEDDSTLLNKAAGTVGPYIREVTLRIEIGIGSFQTVVVDDDKMIGYALNTIDAENEAMLDVFEQQVHWALAGWSTRKATAAWMKFVVHILHMTSTPARDEANNRLALRRLLLKLRINDDCPPYIFAGSVDELSVATSVKPEDLTSLSPWLRNAFAALYADPKMRPIINMLAGNGTPAVFVPLLQRIGVSVDAIDPADPNLLAKLNREKGPDGKYELQAIWRLNT